MRQAIMKLMLVITILLAVVALVFILKQQFTVGVALLSVMLGLVLSLILISLLHIGRQQNRTQQQVRKIAKTLTHTAHSVGNTVTHVKRIDQRTRSLLEEKKALPTAKPAPRGNKLLIVGDDLRFIEPLLPELRKHYEVKIDKWAGPDSHDQTESKKLLEWADIVHCEWFVGNAVWYSWHKEPGQLLTVRLHHFEADREYPFLANRANVDLLFTVSEWMANEISKKIGWSTEEIIVVPNAVRQRGYRQNSDPEKIYKLALVGSVPSSKGLMRALCLLKEVRKVDDRYTLTILGKTWEEFSWVRESPSERNYFTECERFINDNNLGDVVSYSGYVDIPNSLCDYGIVLSCSDEESFHLAPLEAYAAGDVSVVWPWPGAILTHPVGSVTANPVSKVLELRDKHCYLSLLKEGSKYIQEKYTPEKITGLFLGNWNKQ